MLPPVTEGRRSSVKKSMEDKAREKELWMAMFLEEEHMPKVEKERAVRIHSLLFRERERRGCLSFVFFWVCGCGFSVKKRRGKSWRRWR